MELPNTDVLHYRWEKHLPNTHPRYYEVYFQKDLLGSWVLTRTFGRCGSARGQTRHFAFDNYSDGISALERLSTKRRKRRYELCI